MGIDIGGSDSERDTIVPETMVHIVVLHHLGESTVSVGANSANEHIDISQMLSAIVAATDMYRSSS